MKNLRESRNRGTPDLPFSRYHMTNKPVDAMFAHIHWHPELEILYMRIGSVELLTGSKYITLYPGDIAFVAPNQLHCIRSLDDATQYEAFVYSADLITMPESHFFQQQFVLPVLSNQARLPDVLHFNDSCYHEVREALERICLVREEDPTYKMTVFHCVLEICLCMLPCLLPESSATLRKGNETVKKCLAYMDAHYAEKLTLQSIAGHVHLHPNYLCSLFKEHTGQTVFQQLIRIRVEKAAKLLRSRDIPVSLVASQCGFDSTGFFSKKFKQIMGLSPKAYCIRGQKNNFEN